MIIDSVILKRLEDSNIPKEDFETMYNTNPLFHHSMKSLTHGESPELIIFQLCSLIDQITNKK